MKKIILAYIILVSINPVFSQEDSDLVKCIKKNIKYEHEIDSLKKNIGAIKKQNPKEEEKSSEMDKANEKLEKELVKKNLEIKNLSEDLQESKLKIEKLNEDFQDSKSKIKELSKNCITKIELENAKNAKQKEIDSIIIRANLIEKNLKKDIESLKKEQTNIQSLLSEMNGTFFEKKIRDNYTPSYFQSYPFNTTDSVNIRKFDVMIKSLNNDAKMANMKPLLENASLFNKIYFKLLETTTVFDFGYDSLQVSMAISNLKALTIPNEFLTLISKKEELKKQLDGYCKFQSNAFEILKKYDAIKDISVRASAILKDENKVKDYKYIKNVFTKYADGKFDLPKCNCGVK
jgi:hypothetical protein